MIKIKVLFKMFYLYHKAAYDPLIELYENDSQYDVFLSLTDETKRSFGIFDKNQKEKYLDIFVNQGHKVSNENEKFDIVFVPDVVDEKKYGEALLCLIYHGITFTKTVTYRELKNHQDYKYFIFLEGSQSVKLLKSSGSLGSSVSYKIGYPKMDPYFQKNKYDKKEILRSLGLDITKPTVLFAPTYKPTCLYDLKDEIFEATTEYNLIIKLHHYAWLGKYASHNQHKIFENRINQFPHSIIIPKDDYNILPLYFVADTLISEASGAITEFLGTGKTGIIYNLDNNKIKHSDGENLLNFDNSKFLKDSFVHINNKQELKEAIRKALNPSDEMKKSQKIDKDKIFYKLDGKASSRIKKEIESLLSNKDKS